MSDLFGGRKRRVDSTDTDPVEAEVRKPSRLGIRSKLILMAAGPVIIMLGIVITQVIGRVSLYREMDELAELTSLVDRTGALVHELQRERGLTARFLGSTETELEDRLDEQYRRTNESAAQLTESLSQTVENRASFLRTLTLEGGNVLPKSAVTIDIVPSLKSLETHRSDVRRMATDEMENLAFYSSLDQQLLLLGDSLTRWASNAKISNLITAHNFVARASEDAGLERAVLGHAIAKGELPRDRLGSFAGLITSQDIYLVGFFEHATPEFRRAYQEASEGTLLALVPHPYGSPASLSPYRKAAISGDLSSLDAEEWWTVATARMNALDDLEALLLEGVRAEAFLLRRNALTDVAWYVGVGLLSLLGVGMAWIVGGRISRRTRSLTAVAAAVSVGDLSKRTTVTGSDELGILGNAVNRMAGHLAQKIIEKDQFVACVSHELRTPMTMVVGYSELLRSEASSFSQEQRNEMVSTIAYQALEVSSLVQDLLTATRAADGSLLLAEVRVDLKAQVTQVIESLGSEIQSSIAVAGEPAQAMGDPMRVRQIVRNLISNAIKYGGPCIEVRLHDGEHQVIVLVSDNGQGVDIEDRERIFEPYETGGVAGTMPGSIGLGLVVSRTLARMMGGDLTCRYDNGESLFEVTLPAWPSAHPKLAPASAALLIATGDTARSVCTES